MVANRESSLSREEECEGGPAGSSDRHTLRVKRVTEAEKNREVRTIPRIANYVKNTVCIIMAKLFTMHQAQRRTKMTWGQTRAFPSQDH